MSLGRQIHKHLMIARSFARIGVIRKSQFRVEFLSQIVMDTVWYASHVFVFEILFRDATSIAGWNHDELRVFLGFLFVADAWMMIWLGQVWHFGRDLKDGRLDPVRVRPASPIVVYFFQRFSLEACFNMAIALGYLAWGLSRARAGQWPPWLCLPWGLALAFWGRTILSILFSISEFFLLNSDLSQFLHELFMGATDRPLDIFQRRVRAFLLSVVPIGAMVHIPASVTLGRFSVMEGVLHTTWLAIFGLGVCGFWKRCFRRYESALS